MNQNQHHVHHHHVVQMLNVENEMELVHVTVRPVMKEIHMIVLKVVDMNAKQIVIALKNWLAFCINVLIHVLDYVEHMLFVM